MANILVTGGAGYIGSVCTARLLDRGHTVVVIDDLSTGYPEAVPAGATLRLASIGDQAALGAIVRGEQFDAVFHFAAKALIPESTTNPGPFFEANVASGMAMLETLRHAGIQKMVFSSSAAVYGTAETFSISEDHPTRPMNAYGESKLMMERALEWYARAYGWSVVAFRYFNAAGAVGRFGENHQPETHIIPRLLEVAFGERPYFEMNGEDYRTPDGTCLRDYVHVLDLAEAHVLALDALHRPGMWIYNLGTGTPHSVKQVCQAVERLSGCALRIEKAPRRPGDPPVLCASPDKVQRELGWKPRYPNLAEIVESAWAWKETRVKPEAHSSVE